MAFEKMPMPNVFAMDGLATRQIDEHPSYTDSHEFFYYVSQKEKNTFSYLQKTGQSLLDLKRCEYVNVRQPLLESKTLEV